MYPVLFSHPVLRWLALAALAFALSLAGVPAPSLVAL